MTDLTDVEVAKSLGKHKRTIQRWCAAGRLPGAYKAGRSWRIPARSLREAKLARALATDGIGAELRAAILVCEQLRDEMAGFKTQALRAPGSGFGSEPDWDKRNWAVIARDLARLEAALSGLAKLASAVPRR